MADDGELIAGLPCWRERHGSGFSISVTPTGELVESLGLGEGRTNCNYIVSITSRGGGHEADGYFVRVGRDLPYYGVTRAKEQAASRAAARADIGPQVFYASDGVLVTALLDGRALSEQALQEATAQESGSVLLNAMCDTMRALHAVPLPLELLETVDAGAPPCWAPPDLQRWLAYARKEQYCRLPVVEDGYTLLPMLEAAAGHLDPEKDPPRFCHFDLLPDNFVRANRPSDGGECVWVVDFEYAAAGQPLMDVAILSMGASLDAQREQVLLQAYLGAPLTAEVQRRFRALKVLAALRETLWGVVAEQSGSSAISGEEAENYTNANYAKLCKLRAVFELAETSTC
uniref:Aminoglycoside phosphotransferase domain-containing protein n=1 Tax=Coccolithus braarudii TaxID=221442 RepID=A0A7S0LJM1_9EUKA|mmetsp:Transcript_44208/g.94116  ORF Transcript_44208/g.94116 Transcript_44208/m.94116 type:complete len:345 (+) Transcript_44208:31-1065(+)